MKKLILMMFVIFAGMFAPHVLAFSDVNDGEIFKDGIAFLEVNGVVDGNPDGTFKPLDTLNRAELLKITIEGLAVVKEERINMEEVNTFTDKNCFEDVPPNEWYTKYVCYAKNEGWVVGYDGGFFHPAQDVSFVEGLKMVLEAFGEEYQQTNDYWYRGLVEVSSSNNWIPYNVISFNELLKRNQMADMITRIIKKDNGGLSEYLGDRENAVVTFENLLLIDDDPILGNKEALVTMVEFSDYECPFCKRYFEETFPLIKQNYIDTGKVKYVFRDFPLSYHQHAYSRALAAECVRDQGGDEKYWEMHDKLYSGDEYETYVADMGLNVDEFNECFDSDKFYDEINKDALDGQSFGVRGTPSFFINGEQVSGAQPYEAFQTVLDSYL